ncbi:transketolase [Emydomyces testavorans]|uniref:Transketolase n=1 Tax=Emydomyces testavorans TaxID=2070801 RepID=A0AAF0DKN1_9EURO|nr:transketolase [Emydomyces testavorans]
MAPGRLEPALADLNSSGMLKPPVGDDGLFKSKYTEVQTPAEDSRSVEVICGLVLDCCQQWGIGHGGSALGMTAIAQTLWCHVLRFGPAHPDWFDRDRFVLSIGHVGILQYIMLHLAGYEKWTLKTAQRLLSSPELCRICLPQFRK